MDEIDWYREVIRENIDYDLLCMERHYDAEEIDGYVELMAEICAGGREYIRVNGVDVPAELVKERFVVLEILYCAYALECGVKQGRPRHWGLPCYIAVTVASLTVSRPIIHLLYVSN